MRTTYKPQWYESPIDLPEARSGPLQIRHRIIKPGETVSIIGQRQAYLRGRPPILGRVKQALRIHELVEEDVGIWMTDLPEELNQIAEMLHDVRPKGKVLVGGLGLGIVAESVKILPSVESVTVVERSADVIALCKRPGYTIVHKPIEEYVTIAKEYCYDYYLLDCWQGTNEGAWFEEVLPLRRLIRQHCGKKPVIHCWAEDIMLGQILRSLTHAVPHWYYTYLPVPMTDQAAQEFVTKVGLPEWERKYGKNIDKYIHEREEREKEI